MGGKRTRIHCLVDDLPDEVRQELEERLADTAMSYVAISAWLQTQGYDIGKSSIGRYAKRNGQMRQRLREINDSARAYADMLAENPELDIAKVASSVYMQQLATRIVEAGTDDFAEIDLEKAGKLLVGLRRASVYEERYSTARKDDLAEAAELVMQQFRAQVTQDPELLSRIQSLVQESKERAAAMEEKKRG
jgi:hypothetical protein